jgi:hypothetical protein
MYQPRYDPKPTSAVVQARYHEEGAYFHEAALSGHSTNSIAALASARFGYPISASKVQERLRAARREYLEQNPAQLDELRQIEADRLDRYLVALDPLILTPPTIAIRDKEGNILEELLDRDLQTKAIDRALKISAQRAKLLGLDAPVKAELTVTVVDDGTDALLEAVNEFEEQFG